MQKTHKVVLVATQIFWTRHNWQRIAQNGQRYALFAYILANYAHAHGVINEDNG